MITVLVSVGNSDDRLTQREWSEMLAAVDKHIRRFANETHGNWRSRPDDPWQNAAWLFELDPATFDGRGAEHLRAWLRGIAADYRQDAIGWQEIKTTEWLGPNEVSDDMRAKWGGGL